MKGKWKHHSGFVKEMLGIEKDISVERAREIQRNDSKRNKKRTIIVKFLNSKDSSGILNTYKGTKLW